MSFKNLKSFLLIETETESKILTISEHTSDSGWKKILIDFREKLNNKFTKIGACLYESEFKGLVDLLEGNIKEFKSENNFGRKVQMKKVPSGIFIEKSMNSTADAKELPRKQEFSLSFEATSKILQLKLEIFALIKKDHSNDDI